MRYIPFIFFSLVWLSVHAYTKPVAVAQTQRPYSNVDQHADTIGFHAADTLADLLTAPFHTDSEKVRAIFYWVAHNIEYDVEAYHNVNFSYQLGYAGSTDSAEIAQYYLNKYADSTLSRKMGVCEDYASLFKVLCDRAKIECRVVHGCAKNGLSKVGRPFDENHAWNATKINGAWRLLDPCWGSGSCDEGVTEFSPMFNEGYFFTPPELFVLNHYPVDSTFLLLKKPPSRQEFVDFPLYANMNPAISSMTFTPRSGIIKTHIGDTLTIKVVLGETRPSQPAYRPRVIDYDDHGNSVNTDTAGYTHGGYQTCSKVGNTLIYRYQVWSSKTSYLYLDYNMNYLLAYKLEIADKTGKNNANH